MPHKIDITQPIVGTDMLKVVREAARRLRAAGWSRDEDMPERWVLKDEHPRVIVAIQGPKGDWVCVLHKDHLRKTQQQPYRKHLLVFVQADATTGTEHWAMCHEYERYTFRDGEVVPLPPEKESDKSKTPLRVIQTPRGGP